MKMWVAPVAGLVLLGAAAAESSNSPGGRPAAPTYLETPADAKPRVVVTTDPELDDSNSLVRYLLYSPNFRTEGLIYASSQFHWKGDGKGTTLSVPGREYTRFGLSLCPCTSYRWAPEERFIDDALDNYTKAYPNLRAHDPAYPTPAELRSKVRWGNVEFDGDISKDTPGSDLIKSLLLDDEEAPIYLHAWGGQSTIARALKSIEDQYKGRPEWAAIRAKVIRKAVIHAFGDQDDTYANYIKPNWPEIRNPQPAGGIPFGYSAASMVSEADAVYFSSAWTKANVSARGPLGAFYRVWGDGRQMAKGDIFDYFGIAGATADELKKQGYVVWTPPKEKGAFISEGDTATFVNLIDNGLRGYRADSFGGWGGHRPAGPSRSVTEILQTFETAAQNPEARRAAPRAPTHPFLAAAQRDFAARLVWATTPSYSAANHNPRIVLGGPRQVSARPGQRVRLRASVSDPDRNKVTLRWWRWDDADSYDGPVVIDQPNSLGASFRVPSDAKPDETIQIIAEATDDGAPALTRYEKVVVTVAR